MAGSNRKLVCLDLAVLRRLPRESPTSGNGIGRRAFLAGAATAAFAATNAGTAVAKGIGASALRLKRKTDKSGRLRSISVYVDSRHAWVMDSWLYGPEALLEVEETSSELRLRLTNGFLPGTRFAVNFEARIVQGVLSRSVKFQFTDTGVTPCDFVLEAPFDAWVRGEASASAVVPNKILDGKLHGEASITVAGRVAYLSNGGFAFSEGTLLSPRELPLGEIEMVPEVPTERLLSHVGPVTRISASKAGAWRGKVGFEAQGWQASGSLRGFEGAELVLPAFETALLTLSGNGKTDLAASMNRLNLKLKDPRLITLVQPGHRAEILSARLSDQGGWISMPGASFEVGPYGEEAEALFARVADPDGEQSFADIHAGIRNAAFELDGAVTRTRISDVEPVSLVSVDESQIRPTTTVRNPGTTIAQPVQGPGVASRLDITAVPKFRLAPFRIDVFRREDMLALSFEFVNFSIQGGTTNPTLVRTDSTKPAYVTVHFPPQALAEAHFFEGPTGAPQLSANSGPSRRPIDSRLSGESQLVFWVPNSISSISFSIKGEDGKGRNGLLDWARWKPSIVATAVQAYGTPRIRIDSAFINPIDSITVRRSSALAGGVRITRPPQEEPEDEGFLASVKKLAARRGPDAQVGGAARGNLNPNALTQQPRTNVNSQLGKLAVGVDPTLTFKFIPKKRIEPNALHTQIEMPVRVIISPHENAGWHHTAALPSNPPGNKFALWHTRLGHKVEPATAGGEHSLHMFSDDGRSYYRVSPSLTEGPFFVAQRSSPTVRVIDAVDWQENRPSESATEPNPIIRKINSGQFRVEYPMNRSDRWDLVTAMCHRGERGNETPPFDIENLILSPLGGYLKGQWVWKQPADWELGDNQPQLITWRHVSTLGRDHYMKLVRIGYLYPTGHKAVMITISERKFQTTTEGKVVAYVRTREYVAVRDPLITLSGSEVNALGFSSLTLLTLETPVLDVPIPAFAGNVQANGVLKWLYSGGQPVMFKVRGVDQDGRTVNWSMPMIFVFSNTNRSDPARINQLTALYNNEANTIPQGQRRANLFGQMVAYAPGGGPVGPNADGNTSYPVNNMLISAVVTTQTNPVNEDKARWRPVLHTANISAPAVQMMQGKPPSVGAIHLPDEIFDMEELQASTEAALLYDDVDGFDVKIPEVFKQNGFGSSNKSQMFLELLEKVGPKFDDVSKTGGVVNPNMIIQGLGRGKGPLGGDVADLLNGNVDPKKLLDTGARLLGAVKIFDILPNPIKIDPGGTDAPYIELLLIYDDGKAKPPTGATVAIKWKPPLKNWGFDGEPPLFYVNSFKSNPAGIPFGGATGELILEGSITTQFKGGGKPKMLFKGAMNNFRVDLISPASFLIMDFKKIEFIAEVGKPFDVNVDMTKMTFTGPLTFVQKLQDLVNGDDGMSVCIDPYTNLPVRRTSALSTADPGLEVFCDVDESGIRAGLKLTIPTISVGILAIRNISLGVTLILPFFGDPLSARFNFCERNNTFQLSYMGVTGGGFVAMEINIDGEMVFEAAFEVGGSLSFDIGVASGGVSIMAGIYFRLENKECMLEAYIRINGNLSVLGLIRVNLEFYLSLTYYSDGNRLVGTASVTIEIEILFFSVSVTATVQRTLAGEESGGSYFASNELPMADQTVKFTEVVTQPQWAKFCEAYA